MSDTDQQVEVRYLQASSCRRRLADLPLSERAFELLARQGSVYQELRANAKRYHKLRFRRDDGRQVVLGLGTDDQVAKSIQAELSRLQAVRRIDRRLAKLVRKARQTLRDSKEALRDELPKVGYHTWGCEIRKKRGPSLPGMEHQERVALGCSVAPLLPDPMLEGLQFPVGEYRFLFLLRRPVGRFGTCCGRERQHHAQRHGRSFHVFLLVRRLRQRQGRRGSVLWSLSLPWRLDLDGRAQRNVLDEDELAGKGTRQPHALCPGSRHSGRPKACTQASCSPSFPPSQSRT
jgi:hypothetical protein